jgi:sugar lactone lactonase YvrE
MIVGSGHTLYRFNGAQLGERVAQLDMPASNRTNDATVDVDGRLWFGTMDDDEEEPTGALYCLADGGLSVTVWRAVVTNGPAVTPDGQRLYHVSSGERTIWRIPLVDGVCASRGEIFVELGEGEGFPDGIVLDSEDCLWVALWDGWGLRRYAPDGSLLLSIELPCARVTKIAFGGSDLRTGYVTTARVGLTEAQLAEQPLAGSLFAFDAPVPGRILPAVRLA